MKKVIEALFVALAGVVSAIYLLNPTLGVDLIPDNIPIFGNLDDFGAAVLLLSCLSYFGFDLTRVFKPAKEPTKSEKSDVIDIDAQAVPDRD
ncbi:MAG: YkvA family protein [Verrucomicrobiales bacterium]